MKVPCELIVWYVLPAIRKELAHELVSKHGMIQAQVARKFGVTDAAVSQYLKSKRGSTKELEASGQYEMFKKEIAVSAKNIVNGSDIVTETCRICESVKKSGMLVSIYDAHTGLKAPACVCPDHHCCED